MYLQFIYEECESYYPFSFSLLITQPSFYPFLSRHCHKKSSQLRDTLFDIFWNVSHFWSLNSKTDRPCYPLAKTSKFSALSCSYRWCTLLYSLKIEDFLLVANFFIQESAEFSKLISNSTPFCTDDLMYILLYFWNTQFSEILSY